MSVSTSTTNTMTALQICDDWRAKLPDGSRMNKAQLFNLLAPQIAKAMDDAATRMRERCVSELRGRLQDPSLKFVNDGIKAAVIDWTNMLIARLESLTLDGEKEQ